MRNYDPLKVLQVFDAFVDVSTLARNVIAEREQADMNYIEAQLIKEYRHKGVPFKVWVGMLHLDSCDHCGAEFPGGQYRLYLPILANSTWESDNGWEMQESWVDGQAVHAARYHGIALPAHCQDFLVQVPPICPWQ